MLKLFYLLSLPVDLGCSCDSSVERSYKVNLAAILAIYLHRDWQAKPASCCRRTREPRRSGFAIDKRGRPAIISIREACHMAGDARHEQCPNLLIATRRCSARCSSGRGC